MHACGRLNFLFLWPTFYLKFSCFCIHTYFFYVLAWSLIFQVNASKNVVSSWLFIMSGESLDHLLQLKDAQQHFQQPIKKYAELDWIWLNWIWHFSRGKSLFTGEMINLLFWRLTHHFPLATFTEDLKNTKVARPLWSLCLFY